MWTALGRLPPSAANYRAECARYKISHKALADEILMNRQQLSMLLSGTRPMTRWASHNISLGINRLANRPVFRLTSDGQYLAAVREPTGPRRPPRRQALNPLILHKRRPRWWWKKKKTSI